MKEGELTDEADLRLYTVPEVYGYLRISKWKLYTLIHSRKLQSVKIGSRRLIPRKALHLYLEQLDSEAAY